MKKSLRNKNDIQFIIQMNADRKKFLLNADEDEATVPAGIGECDAEPKAVVSFTQNFVFITKIINTSALFSLFTQLGYCRICYKPMKIK